MAHLNSPTLIRGHDTLGFDAWENGLDRNRKNLERFALYSNVQGLTRRRLAPEELFVSVEA